MREGLADGAAVLAATPDFDGQILVADDGYMGVGTGTGAGNVVPFVVHTAGTTYFGQSVQINEGDFAFGGSGDFTVATSADSFIHLQSSKASDDAVRIRNGAASGYSAVRFLYNLDGEGKLAIGVGNSGSNADFAGRTYIQYFDEGGVDAAPDFDIVAFGVYGGQPAQNYRLLSFSGADGDISIRPLVPGALSSAASVFVESPSGSVGVGTTTLASSSKLTLDGNLTLSNATSNGIAFGTNGVAAPGSASAGRKITLYGSLATDNNSFALGIESAFMWLNVGGGSGYKFYVEAAEQVRISSVGTISILNNSGHLVLPKTITGGGTTGNQTINRASGSVNFAAAATSLTVTNSLVTTSSVIIATVATNDATMKSVAAVAASGSFTLHANAAATAETRVNFLVTN